MENKAVQQYLQRYAEAETRLCADWPSNYHYQHVVVIPAYKESPIFLHHLITSTWFQHGVLVILIINQPDTQQDTAPQQALYDFALHGGQLLWQAENLSLVAPNRSIAKANGHILVINRFQHPIPEKQGVGLARKIGTDIALALCARGIISSPWICSTDADATLPDNYFSALQNLNPDTVAACYPFEHIAAVPDADPEVTAATRLYQQALRYYVAGLRYAGSPYAHFTIGSILAFKAETYAQVRGFPKRAAGEDFYLLNKLIKTGNVTQLTQATIRLQARLSDRVPFGTGVSTARIIQLTRQQQAFHYYHPQTFVALRKTLQHFDKLWVARDTPETWLTDLPQDCAAILLHIGLLTIVEKQHEQCRSKQQFDHQITHWFDGLKTLQFIHQLRDSSYPNLPLHEAIREAEFTIESELNLPS